MPIAAGAKLPADVTGFVMENEKPTPKTLGDLTAGKTVVMFGVPGAFTPTCDQEHLPSYVQELANLHAKGVDQVICMSMNDIFVLQEWNKVSGAASILMLSDGNGEITNALDLALDGTGFGLGQRTTRFALIAEDGTVSAIEVEAKAGECSVSAAPNILSRL
ncbi:MAG: peroxiredoxin [Chloroflexi bacterium]|nr:peroxiredoxin [Chloroflexota bacterium]